MSLAPTLHWRFDRSPGSLDPRATFTRASADARSYNRRGRVSSHAANTLRPWFDPSTGRCEGVLIESQRTNLFQYSEQFNTAPWGASNLTVTPNTAVAPDGNTTADTLAPTGPNGYVGQAVSITAGRGMVFSVFVKGKTTHWVRLVITDGVESCGCWFNIADAAVGSSYATNGTISFQAGHAEALKDGWTRIMLEVTTVTSTAWTCVIQPCFKDVAEPSIFSSLYAWGAQLEADSTYLSATSYIYTAGATATRNADNLYINTRSQWYNPYQGTMIFEFLLRHQPPTANSGVQTLSFGGLGDTFANTVYFNRAPTGLYATFIASSVGTLLFRPLSMVKGTIVKIGIAWGVNDVALCLNGSATSQTPAFTFAGSPPRFGFGAQPWSSSTPTSVAHSVGRAFKYYNRRISNADLQTLTSD